MRCNEFQLTFQDTLDQRRNLDDQAELRDHAENCVACRSDLAAWELVTGGLDSWDPLESQTSVENIVAAALRETEPTAVATAEPAAVRPSFDFTTIVAPVLLSAAVLAIVAFVPTMLTNQTNAPSVKPAAIANGEPATPRTETNITETDIADNNSPAIDVLTPEKGRELFVEMQSRLPVAPTLESISTDLSRTNLPTGLRPIAGSFEVAFKTFRNAIPGGSNGSPTPVKPQAGNLHLPIVG